VIAPEVAPYPVRSTEKIHDRLMLKRRKEDGVPCRYPSAGKDLFFDFFNRLHN
jgi:hypothetical protein